MSLQSRGEEKERGNQQVSMVFQRRLQKSGRASLTLSLPRRWIEESKMKAHDVVTVRWEKNGSLRLCPPERERLKSVCVIDADKLTSRGILVRAVVSGYVKGHDAIQIRSKRDLDKGLIDAVKMIMSKLIGLSVVEETGTSMVLRCFADASGNNVSQLLLRIYDVTSLMLNKLIEALAYSSSKLAKETAMLDDEVDRIYYLLLRQFSVAASNPHLDQTSSSELPLEVAGNRLVSHIVEDIGDRCEKSATELQELLKPRERSGGRFTSSLVQLSRDLASLYEKAFRAFIEVDCNAANAIIETSESLENNFMAFGKNLIRASTHDLATVLNLAKMAADMASIVKHCRAIAEITLNRAFAICKDICEEKWLSRQPRIYMNIPD